MHWYRMAESEQATVKEESTSGEQSGHSSSSLSLQYSSSPFEGRSSASDGSDEEGCQRGVVPYSYEPERESGFEAQSRASSDGENRLEARLLNSKW